LEVWRRTQTLVPSGGSQQERPQQLPIGDKIAHVHSEAYEQEIERGRQAGTQSFDITSGCELQEVDIRQPAMKNNSAMILRLESGIDFRRARTS